MTNDGKLSKRRKVAEVLKSLTWMVVVAFILGAPLLLQTGKGGNWAAEILVLYLFGAMVIAVAVLYAVRVAIKPKIDRTSFDRAVAIVIVMIASVAFLWYLFTVTDISRPQYSL